MSDATSAHLFRTVFESLAEDEVLMTVPEQAQRLARRMWDLSARYDFSPYQMYCDEALVKLGLATRQRDTYNPDGYVFKYKLRTTR